MNAVEYSIQYIKRHIPRDVLMIGMLKNDDTCNRYTSIDDKILVNVINNIVKTDLNLLGGVTVNIDLRQCRIEQVPRIFEFLIKVPKSLTLNRSIIAVHHLMSRLYSREDMSHVGNYHKLTSIGIGAKMLSATDHRAIISTSRLELIGENIILCKEPGTFLYNTFMECQVENHENLENIQRHTYNYIANLALEATKMYIWTNQVVALNMGQIYGGHELNIIKEIIDEYKDAREKYEELLLDWSKYSMINSKQKLHGFIKTILGQNV